MSRLSYKQQILMEYNDDSVLSDSPSLGRFTVYGDEAVERKITQIVLNVSDRFEAVLSPQQYRTLALIGGYGRGEGGVEEGPDGTMTPHNNFDFLLVVRNSMSPKQITALKDKLDQILQQAMTDYNIELYLGIVTERTLRHAPRRILWHDIVMGHKTLLGDAFFLYKMTRHADPKKIVAEDVRDLLVNRGTLLLINDLILEKGDGSLSLKDRRVILRHGMKAILGYGDALLWSLGDYHWSYVARQRRMRVHPDIPQEFKELYEEASHFRFYPKYEAYLTRNMEIWQQQIRAALEPIHHHFETKRLHDSNETSWDRMISHAIAACQPSSQTDLHVMAKRIWNALHSPRPAPEGVDASTRFGIRFASIRDLLPILFPVVAYPESAETEGLRVWAMRILDARNSTFKSLLRAYLRTWGQQGDVNFPHTLRVLGLSLAEQD